jgi:hypothetical protein
MRRRPASGSNSNPSNIGSHLRPFSGPYNFAVMGACTVSVKGVLPPDAASVAGLKLYVAPAGKPVNAKLTVPGNAVYKGAATSW